MNLDNYQILADKTVNMDVDVVDNCIIGLYGESGEFVDILKKIAFHKHPVDSIICDKLKREAGDLTWYGAVLVKHYCKQPLHLCWAHDPDEQHFRTFSDIDARIVSYMRHDPTQLTMRTVRAAKAIMGSTSNVIAGQMSINSTAIVMQSVAGLYDCIAGTLSLFGLKLDDCAELNIKKLRERYGEKFSEYAANNRKASDG